MPRHEAEPHFGLSVATSRTFSPRNSHETTESNSRGIYENLRKTNSALDALHLDSDPKVHVLDLWSDFVNSDGTLKKTLFTPDNIHLSLEGYAVYAERLKPLLDQCLNRDRPRRK